MARKIAKRKPPEGDRQNDFFAPYIHDLTLRDQRETMERPFLCLSSRPKKTPIEYTSPDGKVWVRVSPHQDYGMATIHDWDVIIWAASQIREAIRSGQKPPRTIRFHPYNLLKTIRRDPHSGASYERLRGMLDRLKSTVIKTSIRADDTKKGATFSWLDSWEEITEEESGEPIGWELTLAQWLWDGIVDASRILSIDSDYFLLTSGADRWLYRVARKHAGRQSQGFFVTMRELYNKSGSTQPYKNFARDTRRKVTDARILDYAFACFRNDEGEEVVHMIHEDCLDVSEEDAQATASAAARARQAQAKELSPEARAAFWQRELANAERREERDALIRELHQPEAETSE